MRNALQFGLVAALGGPAIAQGPAEAGLPFELKQLGPGVYAAIDGPERKSGSNAGFVIGDDGVLVIDALFTPEAAKALVGEIRRLTPKPIRYVVNTHYHADHTGGDQVLRDAGATIIAHKNVRGWVRTNNINLFGDRITPEIRQRIEGLPLPDITTDHNLVHLAGLSKSGGANGAGPHRRRPDRHCARCQAAVRGRHVVAEGGPKSDRRIGRGMAGDE